MGWFVVEFQSDGASGSIIPFSFVKKDQAMAKYHQILAVAATSNVTKHGAVVFNDTADEFLTDGYSHGETPETNVWFTVEFQYNGETGSILAWAYEKKNDAQAKYHELLSVAAKSNIKHHGSVCFDDDGVSFEIRQYEHK